MHFLSKMADPLHNNKSVPELRDYLQRRGISTSNKNKLQLVRLAEAADTIDIEPLEAPETYDKSSVERRTVVNNDGVSVVHPDVFSIQETDWVLDLKHFPDIEFGDILVYLTNYCQWTKDRTSKYKEDHGYKLFKENHIDKVMYHRLNDEFIYIKATCVPETRQSGPPYHAWILMEMKGYVKSGGCTCVADDGSCKHCVALLFALNAFCDRHRDRGVEVGTDVKCVWDKPRHSSEPAKIADLQFRKKGDVRENFNPLSTNPPLTKNDVQQRLYRVCKDYGSVMVHTIDSQSDEEEDMEVFAGNNYPTLPSLIYDYKRGQNVTDENLLQFLRDAHTEEFVQNVQQLTAEEDKRDVWFEYRKGRITASVMGSVIRCRMDKMVSDNYIVREILGSIQKCSLPATEYGKNMESVAITQYILQYVQNHAQSEVKKCGLFISRTHPFIGATPDGLVKCKCCGEGIIEVKCSFAYQHLSPEDVAGLDKYNLFLDKGIVRLKQDTKWYTQVQTQLGVTGKQWCDFIFFTRKGISVERIYFNDAYFEECVQKATKFFSKFVITSL